MKITRIQIERKKNWINRWQASCYVGPKYMVDWGLTKKSAIRLLANKVGAHFTEEVNKATNVELFNVTFHED